MVVVLNHPTNSVPLGDTVTGSPKHHCTITGDDDFSRDLLRPRAGKDRVKQRSGASSFLVTPPCLPQIVHPGLSALKHIAYR